MKIKETLGWLADYFNRVRGIGHTKAVIHGAQNVDALVMVHNMEYGMEHIKPFISDDVVSFDSIKKFARYKRPLVFDNTALHVIFIEAIEEIERLEKEIVLLKGKK